MFMPVMYRDSSLAKKATRWLTSSGSMYGIGMACMNGNATIADHGGVAP